MSSQKSTSQTLIRLSQPVFSLANIKSALFYYVFLTYALKLYRHLWARGIFSSIKDVYRSLARQITHTVLTFPHLRAKIQSELNQAKLDIEAKLVASGPNVSRHLTLPSSGKSREWILEEMKRMDDEMRKEGDKESGQAWRSGRASGAVYHGGDDLVQLFTQTFERYCLSNPLHPSLFPAIRKMEASIVAQTLSLYHHPSGAGAMTSGGTESILMAVKTHRDWARAVKGVKEPEIVVPTSAHAAFDKAAAYLGIKVHSIPVDPETRKVDLKWVKRAINANTILLVGSAINFPDGNMDPIPELGVLAKKHNIGLHVDCCLGSFVVPFLEEAGLGEVEVGVGEGDRPEKVSLFDFRVEGVTSISCDTHKYGFAPKGSSVVMYRSAELRQYQYYVNPDWSGGVYASPSMSGSRPGALIAGTWAAMQYMGREGYLESCRTIVTTARTIAKRIGTEIPELKVLGRPPASVVAFAARDEQALNVLEVGDGMAKRGWHLNAISGPRAVHIACTRLTIPLVDEFIADLKDAVRDAKANPSGKGTMVALYGLGESSPVGPDMVGELATAFLDALYKA